MIHIILITSLTLVGLGFILGLFLSIASKKFTVDSDPRIEKINEILPGINCGGCGFPSCNAAAEALVKGEAKDFACVAGGKEVATNIAKILGIEAVIKEQQIAIVKCNGGLKEAKNKYQYLGTKTCLAASRIYNGPKECTYGCIGYGDCVKSCPFDAIILNSNNIPVVNREKCTGCGNCVDACPKNIIELASIKSNQIIWCNSNDKGAVVKNICDVGCIACNICVKNCPFDAISMDNFLAKINYEKCTNCGVCVTKCPHGTIVEEAKLVEILIKN